MIPNYLVNISCNGQSRTRVWNGRKPLHIGHPFRWTLEKTDQGVCLRDIKARTTVHPSTAEITQAGYSLTLPHSQATLKLTPTTPLEPAFASRPHPTSQIQVYCCMGTWSMGSHQVSSHFVGEIGERRAFELLKVEGGFRITGISQGLELETLESKRPIAVAESVTLTHRELASITLRWGLLSWIFSSFEDVSLPILTARDADGEKATFRKALGWAAAAMSLIVVLAALWPQPKESELMPLQYTQLDLPSARAGGSSRKSAVMKGVPAFRDSVLRSAVDGVLRGGMNKLLRNSEFSAGRDGGLTVRKLLGAPSSGLISTAPVVNPFAGQSTSVASIGGDGLGGPEGRVGYGQGEHSRVGGQGHSSINLDTGRSSVDEGLTRDEVGEVIHSHLSEVRYCYESAILKTPDLSGHLLMAFTIGGNGSVRSAAVKGSTLKDPVVDDCILKRLLTWKFQQTKGGIDVAVTYPFIFKTLGR